MRKIINTLIVVSTLLVTGCAGMSGEERGTWGGAAVGAGGGALIGNAIDCQGCALIGALLGGAIGAAAGNDWGKRMDADDRRRQTAAINTAPSGQRTAWVNPDTEVAYAVTPKPAYMSKSTGDYCREAVIEEAKVGGKPVEAYGTFCRQPDGAWKMQ